MMRWERDGNEVWNGDCIELMRELPDKSVDMILCDLPYGSTAQKWDKKIPLQALWKEYTRIIKDKAAILLYGTEPFATELRSSKIKWYKYDWHWIKNDATDCMNAKNKPMRKIEKILVFSNGTVANGSNRRMTYYPQGLTPCKIKRRGNDYGSAGGTFKPYRPSHKPYIQQYTNYPVDVLCFAKDKEKLHPTQKPIGLSEYLIRTYTLPGQLVLDNCSGSGTTGMACLSIDRKFILIEKSTSYFNTTVNRIEEYLIIQENLRA